MSARSRYLSAVLMEAVHATNDIGAHGCSLGIDGYDFSADRGRIDFTVPVGHVERLAAKARPALAGQVEREWDDEMRADVYAGWGSRDGGGGMSTVFGALDANDECERRVPQYGLIDKLRREMARDLASGAWDPIGDDLRLAENKTSRED